MSSSSSSAPSIEVADKLPAARPDQLVALIDLAPDRALSLEATLASHPGMEDLARRRKAGAVASDYLTASSPALLYLPGASAKHYALDERVKILAARAYETAKARRMASVVIVLDGPDGAAAAPLAAEGIALGAYEFLKYKKQDEKKPAASPTVQLVVDASARKAAHAAAKARVALAGSVNGARDLVNEPGSVMTPEAIETRAREIAKAGGLEIEVLDHKRLAKEGYEGLLSVGRGGDVPPRMIVLKYDPAGGKAEGKGKGKSAKGEKASKEGEVHLGLLGKGITFDTGGVSIKPAAKMWEMKGDMGGAAAVLHAMETIAREKPKIRVTAIVVTAQNYVDSRAIVPGDIIRGRNGKCIHVDNTDAEGRLILTDGLWRAGEEKVTHLVDVATLTGSIVRAIGTGLSGVFGNDDFADTVAGVAGRVGEPVWRMPLVEEYIKLLDTDVADINNVGGADGGSITAALFLREFLPEGIHWAHLDIAGTFLQGKQWKYFRPGATGVMVRTLAGLAEEMAAK